VVNAGPDRVVQRGVPGEPDGDSSILRTAPLTVQWKVYSAARRDVVENAGQTTHDSDIPGAGHTMLMLSADNNIPHAGFRCPPCSRCRMPFQLTLSGQARTLRADGRAESPLRSAILDFHSAGAMDGPGTYSTNFATFPMTSGACSSGCEGSRSNAKCQMPKPNESNWEFEIRRLYALRAWGPREHV
jgi:hypothetical protein